MPELTPYDVLKSANRDDVWDACCRVECEESLTFFIKDFWEVIEPSTLLVWGWPLDAMVLHLEAVTDGRIKRLLMNVPPGFMKSLLVSVFWPAWEWGPKRMANLRYINTSYSSSLTERDNRRFRNLIASPKFQKRWGKYCSPSKDQFNIIMVANEQTGWKQAASISSATTGHRGDRVIIDDANSVAEAESQAVMESTNTYLREVLPNRLNNMEEGVIVNIQQRTGENDASNTLMSLDVGYDCVIIPMEYDFDRGATSIGWSDPRTEIGELAWPSRFSQGVVENLRRTMGTYAWAGQYQQNPAPRGGGIFKRDWWKLWPPEGYDDSMKLAFPPMEYIIVSVDTAYTAKQENDYSACVMLGIFRDKGKLPKIMLMKAWQEKLEFHALIEKIIETCRNKTGSPCDALLIEAKASGLSVGQEIRRLCNNEEFAVHLINPGSQDKMARAYTVQHLFENGVIYAPDRKYADVVIGQCMIGETLIVTSNGIKRIDEISPGDLVLTHKGRFRTVIAVSERETNDMYSINAKSLHQMNITSEHPIYSGTFTCEKKFKGISWITPKDIKSRRYSDTSRSKIIREAVPSACNSCILPYPISEHPIKEIDLRDWCSGGFQHKYELFTIDDVITSSHPKIKSIIWRQKLDFKFGRVLGLYIAEGCGSRQQRTWSFNGKTEKHLVDELQEFFTSRFGISTYVEHTHNVYNVHVGVPLIDSFFEDMGRHAHNKKIPLWFWDAPTDFLEGVASGYIEGDGCDHGKYITCATTSISLAWGMRLLFGRLGYKPTVNDCHKAGTFMINGTVSNRRKSYTVRMVKDKDAASSCYKEGINMHYHVMDKKEIHSEDAIKVFNMHVLEDNSYVTTSGTVHNCEIFPKGKNDDIVDALVMGVSHLRRIGLAVLAEEGARAVTESAMYRPQHETIAENYDV